MMLGISIILMFGTGIPSLYLWGLIWLAVVELTDRWSLARVCQIPARYGKSLPFLLLGECCQQPMAELVGSSRLSQMLCG